MSIGRSLPAGAPPGQPPGAPLPRGAMSRMVVVTQSNYLPWRGWFDMVRRADALVLLDSVQFTRRDWRNRNRIRTPQGLAWLTVPVATRGRFLQPIDETAVSDPGWAEAHAAALRRNYATAAHAAELPALEALLRAAARLPLLSAVNEALIRGINARLGIGTPILRDVALLPRAALAAMDPSLRLAALAEAAGATRYLTGPAARAYLDPAPFAARGIAVEWMDHGGRPPYPQTGPGFEPAVSVVDLLLNAGPAAAALLGRAA